MLKTNQQRASVNSDVCVLILTYISCDAVVGLATTVARLAQVSLAVDFSKTRKQSRLLGVIVGYTVIFYTRQQRRASYLPCESVKMIESSLASLGAKVVVASSSDENHPPENITDGLVFKLLHYFYILLRTEEIVSSNVLFCVICYLSRVKNRTTVN